MRDAVVFNSNNQLEFQEVRMNVTRIPEVLSRIREAGDAWDDVVGASTEDLTNFMSSEDERFAAGPRRRLVVVGVVQVGLFDRYVRTHGQPEFLIGAAAGPLAVALGQTSLGDFVADSAQATKFKAGAADWWRREGEAWTKLTAPAAFDRMVSIGPGGATGGAIDSIDLDPALGWFWTSLGANRFAVAN